MERQYLDVAGSQADLLRINSQTVEGYLRNFQWDYARYQHSGRQLVDLVAQVQTMAATVDEELKKLSVMYNEKNLALSNLQRKKTINLATSDFEDFLSPEKVSRLDIFRADAEKFLETVFVVVPKGIEQGLLSIFTALECHLQYDLRFCRILENIPYDWTKHCELQVGDWWQCGHPGQPSLSR